MLKIYLNNVQKHIQYYQIKTKDKNMINMVIQHLIIMDMVDSLDLMILICQVFHGLLLCLMVMNLLILTEVTIL